MDRLDEIFRMQQALNDDIIAKRHLEGISNTEWIQKQTLAMLSEMAELLDEVNFKWWKNPKPGDDHAVNARTLRGTDDRAEIVGVLQLVENHEEGRLAALLRVGEDVLHRAVFLGGGKGDNALVRSAAAEEIQLGAVGFLDGNLLFARLGEDSHHRTAAVAARHQDLINGSAAADGLADGVPARDNVGLLLVYFVFHIGYLVNGW